MSQEYWSEPYSRLCLQESRGRPFLQDVVNESFGFFGASNQQYARDHFHQLPKLVAAEHQVPDGGGR